MWNLVYKEFVQIRTYLLQIFGFLTLAVVIFGRATPAIMMSYLYVFPVVVGMTLPQIIFGQEERGNTFTFLRALPIRPREIVAAKYLVSVAVTLVFAVLLAVLGPIGSVRGAALMAALSAVILISFALAAVSYFLHFWLGVRSARVALLLVTFGAAIPMMLVFRGGSGGVSAALAARLSAVGPLAGSPAGVVLALGLGLGVLYISYSASAWLFAKRDLSRLP
jgi:predicted permease